jgi:hypothetical protein
MNEFALLNDKQVVRVIRKDHYGDKSFWLVDYMGNSNLVHHMGFVRGENCVLLDPALNVLFEREENG